MLNTIAVEAHRCASSSSTAQAGTKALPEPAELPGTVMPRIAGLAERGDGLPREDALRVDSLSLRAEHFLRHVACPRDNVLLFLRQTITWMLHCPR
jgi:hypothetical protein